MALSGETVLRSWARSIVIAKAGRLVKTGAQILEERVNNGRHVRWVAAPDAAQMELTEKV